tara:strand:+ start:779 stop:1054 length:276 start_codon:yes stop_codon:yes gene_type:complete
MIKMSAYFGKQQQKENRMYYFEIETVKHGYDLESEIETMSLEDLQELADLEELPDESVRKDILKEIQEQIEGIKDDIHNDWLYRTHYAGMR